MPLCLMVAVSAAFGYILANPVVDLVFLLVVIGLFLLSCGAAALNSLQEMEVDRLLERTRARPLVTGALSKRQGAGAAVLCMVCGLTLLLGCGRADVLVLAVLAVLLYNGIYTPMKQVSSFALIPGGIAGAIPSAIGWFAGGGVLSDIRFYALFALFFLWQIPHFCMVALRYRQAYLQAGAAGLPGDFPEPVLRRILFSWLLCWNFTALTFTILPDILSTGAAWTILLLIAVSTVCFVLFLPKAATGTYRWLFILFNVQLLLFMLLIGINRLLLLG